MTAPVILLGRGAALSALGAGVAAIAVLLVLAVVWLVSGSPSEDGDLQMLARLEAHAAARPQAERALATTTAQAAALPSLLHGERSELAQSALQSDLKALTEAHGGEVRSALPLPPVAEQGLERISVQYDLVVPASKLRALAHAIESHAPYLFISSVDLSGPQVWPAEAGAPEPKYDVRWTVSGYRRSDGK